jgi:hypothetical protein
MHGWKKAVLICTAVLSGVAAVALVLVACLIDLDTADRAASVIGSVVGLAGLVLSLWALLASRSEAGVEAFGAGAVAAGSIGRAVTGNHNQLSGQPSAVPQPRTAPASSGPVRAEGERSVAAGEAIGDAVTGEGNTL